LKALVADPRAPGGVAFADVAEPEPAPDHAVVAVAAFSANRGETYQLEQPRPGWRPGKDIAGVVSIAAADGSGPPVGTRVVGHADQDGWAERAAVPVSRLAELPEEMSFVTAAALPLAGLTALRLLRVTGPLPSRTILLTGASGGLGHYFTELAAGQGALVTAIAGSADRGARLSDLGAIRVLPDVESAAGPFDIAIDSVGGATTKEVWHRLHQHGLLIWLGQASRVRPELDYFDWDGAMSVTIRKFNYLDSTHTEAQDLATLVRLVAGGRLHPEIGWTADWAGTGDAIGALLKRAVRGNIVLTIGSGGPEENVILGGLCGLAFAERPGSRIPAAQHPSATSSTQAIASIPPSPPSRRPHPSHKHQPPRPHDHPSPSMRRVSASRRLAICIRRPDLRKAENLRVTCHTRHTPATRRPHPPPPAAGPAPAITPHARPADPASPPEGTPPPMGRCSATPAPATGFQRE
jgi:NADPH2:quinone reductase